VIEGGKFTVGALVVLNLASWLEGRSKSASKSLTPEVMEEARARLDARERAIDDGEYKGLDQQQENLGSIDMTRLAGPGRVIAHPLRRCDSPVRH
jgi:hypothetical protein